MIVPLANVICLVVDRLHAGMIGAYGNTWITTPELDHLAAESCLFDQAVIDSPHLESLYRSYWLGRHVLARDDLQPGPSMVQMFQQAGYRGLLLTDEAAVARHSLAAEFAEQHLLEMEEPQAAAEEIGQTQMARFFATAAELITAERAPFFAWLHCRGMGGPWDAPLELRRKFADEEDPTPPDLVDVPGYELPEEHDPDEVLGLTHAYAGQVSLFDTCVGGFLDELRETGLADNAIVVLLSARGISLGEHRRMGLAGDPLYNEIVQMPWLMRFPGSAAALTRSQALVQPQDLYGTLLEWLELGGPDPAVGAQSLVPILRDEAETIRDRAILYAGPKEWAIRTRAWHLRVVGREEAGRVELFSKPSDRWEVNEIADRVPEVTAALKEALLQFEQERQFAGVPPLAEPLVSEVD